MSEKQNHIVIIGAGVTGLTTALLLTRRHNPSKITIVASNFPGSFHPLFTSPWAGANFHPFSKGGSREADWDTATWHELSRLAREKPEAGVHFLEERIFRRDCDIPRGTRDWYADLLPTYRMLEKDELPSGADVDWGVICTSVCLDPNVYLLYLQRDLEKAGVRFRQAHLDHILQGFELRRLFDEEGEEEDEVDVVVNCTGLLASQLGGVQDSLVKPLRGQIVLVENEAGGMFDMEKGDWPEGELCYIMQRPNGAGTILGGSMHFVEWNGKAQDLCVTVDPELSRRIKERAIKYCPALVREGEGIEGLRVIKEYVGFRPYREGGPRIEREAIGGREVVHGYGASGFGFQASYGIAADIVDLVAEALGNK